MPTHVSNSILEPEKPKSQVKKQALNVMHGIRGSEKYVTVRYDIQPITDQTMQSKSQQATSKEQIHFRKVLIGQIA